MVLCCRVISADEMTLYLTQIHKRPKLFHFMRNLLVNILSIPANKKSTGKSLTVLVLNLFRIFANDPLLFFRCNIQLTTAISDRDNFMAKGQWMNHIAQAVSGERELKSHSSRPNLLCKAYSSSSFTLNNTDRANTCKLTTAARFLI